MFRTPTYDQMRQTLLDFGRFLFPDRNFSALSFLGRIVRWVAAATTDLHAHVDDAERNVMPDTAQGAHADHHGRIWGVARKGPTPARKEGALRVTGTVAATVSTGDQLRDPNTNLVYQVNEDAAVGASGYVDVDIVAVDTGSRTRIPAGTVLEFVASLPGISARAELQRDLDEDGSDTELDGSYRLRYLAVIGERPLGGAQPDFVSWARELAWVAEAYCYPNRAGLGSIDVAAMHTNRGALSGAERTALLDYLRARAPAHLSVAGGDLRVLETTAAPTNVEVLVTADGRAASRWDWDDPVTPVVVVAWDGPTKTLSLSVRPASMAPGGRIIIKDAAALGDGAQVTIDALGANPADIILERVPTDQDGAELVPVAGDEIYSGGPLVDPIRDAILAHLGGEILYAGPGKPLAASVAPSVVGSTSRLEVLAEPIGTANPGRIYGAWPGGLYLSTLTAIARYVRGVANAEVAVPVADIEAGDPAVPDDAAVGVLVAGRVIVRRA